MKKVAKILGLVGLLCLPLSLFAVTIQCQKIPHTPIKQCKVSKGRTGVYYAFTNMPYALCSRALCTVDPKHPQQARCTCPVYKKKDWTSLSLSPTPYAQAKPSWHRAQQLATVQSNFSLANAPAYAKDNSIICRFNQPKAWADCFGVRCTVNKAHQATCLCPVKTSKVFAISKPGNEKKCITKPKQIWSGIFSKDAQRSNQVVEKLYTTLYPSSPVNKNRR